MAEYMHLVGAEDVSRAASTMSSAASEISGAARSIDWSMEQQRRFMDDWLQRFEEVVEKLSG